MNENQRTDLTAAISLMLDEIRPTSMQFRVMEVLVNRQANGIPAMTYDLEVANMEFAKSPLNIQVPSIWELIALDIAPHPNFWDNVEYAKQNAASIRNAVYGLQTQFERLSEPEDNLSLYIFNKFGANSRDINVVTLIHDYEDAVQKSQRKRDKLVASQVNTSIRRIRRQGKTDDYIVAQLAGVLDSARKAARLPPALGEELRRLENK